MIYPIISFSEDKNIFLFRNADELSTCSRTGYNNGFYNNLVIVDCNGSQFKVENAIKAPINLAGTILSFFSLRSFKVELTITFLKQLDLKQFKIKVLESLDANSDFWNSAGDIEMLISFVNRSDSFKDLIEGMTSEFYRRC